MREGVEKKEEKNQPLVLLLNPCFLPKSFRKRSALTKGSLEEEIELTE